MMEFALAIVLIILGTVGLIGNIVSILILNTHQMKSKVNFMLQGKVVHKILFPKLHNFGLKVFIFFYLGRQKSIHSDKTLIVLMKCM